MNSRRPAKIPSRLQLCLLALVASLSLAMASPAFSAIFRTVDAQGNVTFTDQPPKASDTPVKSEEIKIATPNTFQDSTPYERWDPEPEAENSGSTSYTLSIVSPSNEESIRNNAGNVVIRTRINPELSEGHVARLELNGTLTGEAIDEGAIYLTNMPRGTHRARLVIESESGRRLAESVESVFHLQRISVFSPSRSPPPPPAGS